jgi:hypothetical protein
VQAVRVDGTIIVLHSGNYELVCLRHRGSQTLYVSDLIEPPTCTNPGYGKLQVGIYVAVIQDTIDRHKQLLHATSEAKSPGDDNPIGGDNDKDDDDASGGRGLGKRNRFKGRLRRKDVDVNELVAIEVLWLESCTFLDHPDHDTGKQYRWPAAVMSS